MTPDEIARFQASHRNHLGLPLAIDGDLGPETEWALAFETLSRARRAVVVTAQTFLGLEESPPRSNRDPSGTIQDWVSRCSAQPGDPWCAAFASRCLGFVRFASAQRLGKAYPAAADPWPGDVMWYPTGGDKGHCGIVIGADGLEVMTIEGNCDNAVRCVRRPLTPVNGERVRFGRTLPDVTGRRPGVVPSAALPGGGTR